MAGGGHKRPATGAARRLAAALAVALAIAPAGVAAQEPKPAAGPAGKAPPAGKDAPAGKAAPSATAPGAGAQAPVPAGPPQLAARAWILVDPRDGEVLASKAAHKPRPIASATKLMTAYVALKKLKPSQTLTAPPYPASSAESLLGLGAGEKMRVRDLLYALMLPSANDAAVTLATGAAGSVPRFVALMNRQAEALGLANTSFSTPVGLDAPQNYSSAADLVALASEDLENPLFERIVDTPAAVLRSGAQPRRITTRNTLLLSDPTVDGIKTGHTLGAGYVLVASATRDGTRLVSAVLGAGSEAARDAETEKLLDYGFSLYEPSRPVRAGEELASPGLDYRDEDLSLVAKDGIEVSAREGQPVETEVRAPEEVSGAVAEGEKLGTAIVSVDGRRAGTTALVAAEAVAAASLADKVLATVQNPLILLPLGGIVIVVGVLLAARGRRPREPRRVTEPAAVEPQTTRPPARRKRERSPRERTPEERRKMHEERMRRRREREQRGSP